MSNRKINVTWEIGFHLPVVLEPPQNINKHKYYMEFFIRLKYPIDVQSSTVTKMKPDLELFAPPLTRK